MNKQTDEGIKAQLPKELGRKVPRVGKALKGPTRPGGHQSVFQGKCGWN